MGTFWASSRALAYAASLVLAAGLLNACDLNPQPTPPEKLRGGDEPGSTSAASTAGGIAPQPTNATATSTSGATTGSPIVDGEDDGEGSGAMDPDDEMLSPPGGGGGLEGGYGGAAGAAGAGTDEPLPPPANAPH